MLQGLDEEITLIRVKLRSILEHEPDNTRLITQAATTLTRLMRTRKTLGLDGQDDLAIAIRRVINDIGIPLMTGASRAALLTSNNLYPVPTQTDRV